MVNFKTITYTLGISSFILLFGVSAFIFFGFVEKESIPVGHVKFKVKEKAKALDVWQFTKGGKYRIKARSMIKEKNGVILLFNDELWVYKKGKAPVYIRSDRAYIYPNHDVMALGHVFLKRGALVIKGSSAFWDNRKQIVSSTEPFRGYNDKSKFSGRSFVYYNSKDMLIANGVDIWLK